MLLAYFTLGLFLQNLKQDFDKEEPNLQRIYVQFPKLLKELGIKVDPVEDRFRKVKEDFYQTKTDLYKFGELVDKQVAEASTFKLILDDLKEWIPKIKAKTAKSRPINGDREDIERQKKDLEVRNLVFFSCYICCPFLIFHSVLHLLSSRMKANWPIYLTVLMLKDQGSLKMHCACEHISEHKMYLQIKT